MEAIPFVVILAGVGFWWMVRRSYKKGYAAALADRDEYAKQKLASYADSQQWVYEDSLTPTWRYSKVTGVTQRRYLRRPESFTNAMLGEQTRFTEWRNVEQPEPKPKPRKRKATTK